MKTYILRNSKTVDARKKSGSLLWPTPAPAAVLKAGSPVLYIGLDVHNDTIAVSLAPSDSTEVRRYGIIGGTHDDVLKLCKKLQGVHPGTELRFCYEAGPRGYPLCRFIGAHGHACMRLRLGHRTSSPAASKEWLKEAKEKAFREKKMTTPARLF